MEITLKVNITNEDIDDIMCTAFEGGITYWCHKVEVVGEYLGEYASDQISRGGELLVYDAEDDETLTLTKEKFLKGIELAIQGYYYSEYKWFDKGVIDTCNIDAEVADVIIQLALFGEIVYG